MKRTLVPIAAAAPGVPVETGKDERHIKMKISQVLVAAFIPFCVWGYIDNGALQFCAPSQFDPHDACDGGWS